VILMESYRNMIETNLTLMEKVDDVAKILETASTSINNLISAMHTNHSTCKTQRRDIKDEMLKVISIGSTSNEKIHNNQNLKLLGTIGLLITIILALVGLIAKIWP
jgi:hypothetical protein